MIGQGATDALDALAWAVGAAVVLVPVCVAVTLLVRRGAVQGRSVVFRVVGWWSAWRTRRAMRSVEADVDARWADLGTTPPAD